MSKNNKDLELTVLKLLKKGSIDEEEAQKLLSRESKKAKNHVFRNLIIWGLIVAAGFAAYKAFQPNITKRTEDELRQILAEGIDRNGHGYLMMPMATKGMDYDGKKYNIEFHDNKGIVIEKGREFILPMSVKKEGKICWYDLRVRDNELISMKRKTFVVGGGCDRYLQDRLSDISEEIKDRKEKEQEREKLKKGTKERQEKLNDAKEKSKKINFWKYGIVGYFIIDELVENTENYLKSVIAKTTEVQLLERMWKEPYKGIMAAYWHVARSKDLKMAWDLYPKDFNLDGKMDLAGRCTDKNYNNWIIFLTSDRIGYKINGFKRGEQQMDYMTRFSLIEVKHHLNSASEYSWLKKLHKELKLGFRWDPKKPEGFERGLAKYCCSLTEEAWVGDNLKEVGADWYYYKDGQIYRLQLTFQPENVSYFPCSTFKGLCTPRKVLDKLLRQ